MKDNKNNKDNQKTWRLFSEEKDTGSKYFSSKYSIGVAAFATHLCIGSPYGWSIMASKLTQEQGIVSAACMDWTLA